MNTDTSAIVVKAVVSARLRVDNSGEAQRTAEIEAMANLGEGHLESLENGTVRLPEKGEVASFSAYGRDTVSCTHLGSTTRTERQTVNSAVEDFIEKAFARTFDITSI